MKTGPKGAACRNLQNKSNKDKKDENHRSTLELERKICGD